MTSKITDEKYPIHIKQDDLQELVHGADWGWSFQLMENDNVTPIDTTGYACVMEIREGENGELYDSLSIGDGITMTAASGLFNIRIDDSVVDTYTWRTATFKVIITDTSSNKTPFFIGKLTFAGDP